MPYRTNDDLPVPVRRALPQHAQDIYREAFNHAFPAHADDPSREAIAARIAWSAVKHNYAKVDNAWVPNLGTPDNDARRRRDYWVAK